MIARDGHASLQLWTNADLQFVS